MTFKTSDIVLAACLRLDGAEISEILLSGNKGTFVFTSINQKTVDDYDLGNHHVEPVTFNNAIKQLTTSVRRIAGRP